MLLRKSILSLIALFMSVSGMPVYAEQAPEPEVMERKDDTAAFTEAESAVGIKKLYAEEPGTLMSGPDFNEAIKSLAAGSSKYYLYPDSLIKTVEVVDALPSGKSTNAEIEAAINHSTIRDVSKDNNRSYLAWWDAETLTIYLYSKSGDIVLNPDSSYIFNNCYSLTTLDVSDWDTSSVTNMIYMFSDCKNLTTLDVSKWNTGKVTDMNSLFSDCTSLTTLDVSKWNTGNVTNMSGMFLRCSNLTTLDVSMWDTSQVKLMGGMFLGCTGLTALDVSKWNINSVTYTSSMFRDCTNLAHIYIGSGWNTSKVTSSNIMFYGCINLPNFNSKVVDKTNANAGPGGYMEYKS